MFLLICYTFQSRKSYRLLYLQSNVVDKSFTTIVCIYCVIILTLDIAALCFKTILKYLQQKYEDNDCSYIIKMLQQICSCKVLREEWKCVHK